MTAIDFANLPQEVLDKVCVCPDGFSNGWTLNKETGWWVESKCGKPTRQAAILECDICGNFFVHKFYEKVKNRDFGAMCDACDPPLGELTK